MCSYVPPDINPLYSFSPPIPGKNFPPRTFTRDRAGTRIIIGGVTMTTESNTNRFSYKKTKH